LTQFLPAATSAAVVAIIRWPQSETEVIKLKSVLLVCGIVNSWPPAGYVVIVSLVGERLMRWELSPVFTLWLCGGSAVIDNNINE